VTDYERVYPMRNNVVKAEVPPGGTIDPVQDGTTYICTGGGGQSLAATATSGWFGTSGGGDMATTGTGAPSIEVWGSETSGGIGSGGTSSQPDTVTGWSAYRRAQYCHLVIDVTAPKFWGGRTSLRIGPSTRRRAARRSPRSPARPSWTTSRSSASR
jgi:hypothetical protein